MLQDKNTKYDNYKDSGIEWIGKIPLDWKLSKYKYFARSGMGETILSEQLVENGIPVYSATQEEKVFGYVSEANVKLKCGDFVIPARGNSIGCVTFVKNDLATCTQTTIFSKLNGICNKFLYYCCLGLKDHWFNFDDTAIPQITVKQVQNNPLPLPPIQVQQAIADYLDKKCDEIDKVVETEKAVIEKLKEYKQSIITEAVTKGLDKSVPLKDSGIEWIGKIPQHWEKIRLRFLCKIQTGDKDTINKDDNGAYPFYVRSPIVEKINTYTFDGEAILTAGDGVGAGKVFHYVTGKFDYHQRVYNLHNFNKIYGKFLYHYLKENFYKEIEKSNAKSTVDSIRLHMLLDFPVVFPKKINEQQQIAEYLDKKCSEIDKAIADKEKLIEKFTEYKKSLIYECVTGKKEVA